MVNDLFFYLKQVQRRAGLTVSSSFPSTATDDEQLVLDSINETLRELNNRFHWIFKQTEYTLTTTAGTREYDLTQAPYSQTMWRVQRLARHGVRRASDDMPLQYIPYEQLDYRKPSLSSQSVPGYYSQYGVNLIFYPTPDGSQLKIRYHGIHIGTDSGGSTKKITLTATGDLVFLDDQWQDVLVYGAASSVRRQQKIDEKYKELSRKYEELVNALIDMGNQPGDDAPPEVILPRYIYQGNALESKYYPFFSNYPGA